VYKLVLNILCGDYLLRRQSLCFKLQRWRSRWCKRYTCPVHS